MNHFETETNPDRSRHVARRGPLNKLKLLGIKGGQNEKKPNFFCLSRTKGGRREGVEREALTYL